MSLIWNNDKHFLVMSVLGRIRDDAQRWSVWDREAMRQTNGIPIYGDVGGIIVFTPQGDFLLYHFNSEEIIPVTEGLWYDVALAYLKKGYPELHCLLPGPPQESEPCATCSGSGWTMDQQSCCSVCRGRGWIPLP